MDIKINGIYKHYKGRLYKVIAIGTHTETNENLIIYEAQYGNHLIWCRPFSMWNDIVEYNGNNVKRFELIEENYGQV